MSVRKQVAEFTRCCDILLIQSMLRLPITNASCCLHTLTGCKQSLI